MINKAIDEWRSRLEACVRANWDDVLNICFVEHKHYFFACLTVCEKNFINEHLYSPKAEVNTINLGKIKK